MKWSELFGFKRVLTLKHRDGVVVKVAISSSSKEHVSLLAEQIKKQLAVAPSSVPDSTSLFDEADKLFEQADEMFEEADKLFRRSR